MKNKFLYISIFFIFFIPRIIGLGSDIANYDSSFWYPRMDNFSKYILRGEYKKTYQQYHPGVVLLWTSGTSKYLFEKTFEAVFDYNPRFMPHQFTRLHFVAKFPLVFLISILGLIQFYFVAKMSNKKFAVIFATILSLEPFFLGTSRFLHLSALTSMFMFTSFLSMYYHFHTNSKNKKFFYLSAILLGLGALTKIDAIIAGPVNALLILFFEYKRKTKLFEMVKLGLIYALLTSFTFYILFPSMWVEPIWTLNKIFGDGIQDTAFSSSGADTITGLKFMFYPETIFFRSLPTFFFGLIGGLFILISNLKKKSLKINKSFLVWILFFIVFNIVILSIPDKIKDRYLINLYPPLSVIVALFVYYAVESKKKLYKYFVVGIFSFFYILTAYKYHPVYSYYYTELVGGPGGIEKLGLPIKNRGEFYAQAALYINKTDSNPEVRNVILSHREQIRTFPPFFLGETFTNPGLMKEGYFADYIVTRPDYDRLVTDSELKNMCKLVKQFGPKNPLGYNTLNLYKCEGVTNEYKNFRN
ncbi:hypothetical protein CO178_02285 [candidate division WWE3 bacterium CG_4_9_14_3_um_filter_34_6]|uniref:Glycosyltransferase RgtA/B/C/D-like domain-containing protein n=1 Tax=candidate division WWE3 bacterium CG_4_9_14_3_um_filter_34_6 TaxID=1975079 RepID=A0A2M7X2J8_UNCKA|nr:MAG: hypothetical protein CO178_02285 [candidate division WWE3 bacterium CG_4_9_14_3_um_filter_34_6]